MELGMLHANGLENDLKRIKAVKQASASGGGLSQWLADNGMAIYEDQIRELGVTEVEDLPFLTVEDLTSIGVRGVKQRRFVNAAKAI